MGSGRRGAGLSPLREAPGLNPAAMARVSAWMGRLGHAVKAYYDRPPGRAVVSDKINNHLYWAALATAASAIVAGDRALFDWAMAKTRFALAQIEPDGTLPLELARAGKALHYHLFSVTPLVAVAEIAAANGIALYAEGDGALRRLVARVAEGADDPTYFARLTGTPQDFVGSLSGWNLAWAEIWCVLQRFQIKYSGFENFALSSLMDVWRKNENNTYSCNPGNSHRRR